MGEVDLPGSLELSWEAVSHYLLMDPPCCCYKKLFFLCQYFPTCLHMRALRLFFHILKGCSTIFKAYFYLFILEKGREREICPRIHSSNGSNGRAWAGLNSGTGGTQFCLSHDWQGLKYLSHHLQPPRVYINRKLKLGAELRLRNSSCMVYGHPNGYLNHCTKHSHGILFTVTRLRLQPRLIVQSLAILFKLLEWLQCQKILETTSLKQM